MSPSTELLRFILLMPDLLITDDFTLRDLPGSGKRIDILCRTLAACFDWGPEIWPKEKLELMAVLSNQITLQFRLPQKMPISEVEWAIDIRDALNGNPPEYVNVSELDLHKIILHIKSEGGHIWVLEERGTPFQIVQDIMPMIKNSFMLGNHKGFDEDSLRVIKEHNLKTISLGKTSYLGSHCVAAVIARMEMLLIDK